MSTIYYTYIYLNPNKPGKYTYDNKITFFYEPFYVGKGKDSRWYAHLYEAIRLRTASKKWINKNNTNPHKLNTIIGILNDNKSPIIIKLQSNLTNDQAHLAEIILIDCIGRRNLKVGPLTNITNGGTGGDNISAHSDKIRILKNRIYKLTNEHKLAISKGLLTLFSSEEGAKLKQKNSEIQTKYFQFSPDNKCN